MWIKQKMELIRKVGLFGLRDLRKLAPIGDLDYANGWSSSLFKKSWVNSKLPIAIMEAAREQGFKFECISYNNRGTDTHYCCQELGLHYHVDSSD